MEYMQEIVDSGQLRNVFNLPFSLQNRRVEIIIRPIRQEKAVKARQKSALFPPASIDMSGYVFSREEANER